MTQATPIPDMLARWATSHISGGNAEYVDALYEVYLQDPNAVAPEWRDYFDQLPRVPSETGHWRQCPVSRTARPVSGDNGPFLRHPGLRNDGLT